MVTESPGFNDPFASIEGSGTVLRPRPGGWASLPTGGGTAADGPSDADQALPDHGLNPLLALANRLLVLVPRLRSTQQVGDVAALRASLAQGVREFAAAAAERGIAPERVMAARYVLCTMIDEAAADTPWGGSGMWARHSLLAEFHNEVFGGEKVFQLMARLAENPGPNIELLELIYATLALGFEGRFRVVDQGATQLDAVRAKLAQIIRQQRGAYPVALAEHWQGQPVVQRRALSWLPLTLTGIVALLLLGAVYAGLIESLAGHADPVYAQIQRLRLSPPVAVVAQPAPRPRLAVFLAADIRAGLVTVRDEVDRSVVVLRGDGLFDSGSATLLSEQEPLMRRIADALVRVGGEVLVTGHTDSTPIRTARFPSNWHLSQARADAVRDIFIADGVPADRVRAEGRGDGEPVASNDTARDRALNRRVEITLLTARATARAPAGAASR